MSNACCVTSTMPLPACCLQYVGVLLPSKLKIGTFVQESCEQRLLRTSTMSPSRCCLVTCYLRYFSLQIICTAGRDRALFSPRGRTTCNERIKPRRWPEGRRADLQVSWPAQPHLSPAESTLSTKFSVLLRCIIANVHVVVFRHSVVGMVLPVQGRLHAMQIKL